LYNIIRYYLLISLTSLIYSMFTCNQLTWWIYNASRWLFKFWFQLRFFSLFVFLSMKGFVLIKLGVIVCRAILCHTCLIGGLKMWIGIDVPSSGTVLWLRSRRRFYEFFVTYGYFLSFRITRFSLISNIFMLFWWENVTKLTQSRSRFAWKTLHLRFKCSNVSETFLLF